MEPRPVAHSQSVLVHWLGPTDLNSAGFVHGGEVMKLCDQVGGPGRRAPLGRPRGDGGDGPHDVQRADRDRRAADAARRSTPSWRTSMEVGVRVEAERPASGTVRHTSAAYLTMVAVDDEGRPRPAPRCWSRTTSRSGASGPPRRGAATDWPNARRSWAVEALSRGIAGSRGGAGGAGPAHAGLPAAVVLGRHRDRGGASSASSRQDAALKAEWLAEAFIQVIKAVTGPVIFVTVVIGIASLGNMARAGGLALRALAYFFTMTVVALGLGLIAGNLVKPGSRLRGRGLGRAARPTPRSRSARPAATRASSASSPTTCCRRASSSRSSRTRSCACSCSRCWWRRRSPAWPTEQRERIVGVFEVAGQIIFGVIRLIMWAAPLGAFGGMAFTVAAVRAARR